MSVIPFKKPANGDSVQPKHPPMFNIPPLTLAVLAVIIVVQLAQDFTPSSQQEIWYDLAFVPARYWALPEDALWATLTPITHIFLHGGWLHVAMNGLMFLAFGAAAERMLGPKKSSVLFLACGLAGAAAQFALAPHSPYPMVGASGALSGLFAAVILRMMQAGTMPAGRLGICGIAALWVGLSFITALVGGEIGIGNVAWAAHAGGFFAGIAMMKWVFK